MWTNFNNIRLLLHYSAFGAELLSVITGISLPLLPSIPTQVAAFHHYIPSTP